MKAFKFTFILAILVSFAFISCDNEPLTGTFTDESGVPGTGGSGGTGTGSINTSFFAKVDGVDFLAVNVVAGPHEFLSGRFIVEAFDSAGNKIRFDLEDDMVPGTYAFDGSDFGASYDEVSTDIWASNVIESNLVITSHDFVANKVIGTFEFKSTPAFGSTPIFDITEGTFDVTY